MYTTQHWKESELFDCKEPQRPAGAGKYWTPLPQHTAIAVLRQRARQRGWAVWMPTIHLDRGGEDMHAVIPVSIPNATTPSGSEDVLGLSNRQSRPVCLYYGLRWAQPGFCLWMDQYQVCKHTPNVLETYRERVGAYLAVVLGRSTTVGGVVRQLQRRHMTRSDIERALVSSAAEGVVPWSRLGKAHARLQGPSRVTAWSVLTALALELVPGPSKEQMPNGVRLYRLIAGLV